MYKMTRQIIPALLIAIFSTTAFAQETPPPDPLAVKAAEILKNDIGRWSSTWEWFGEDGEFVRTQQGEEEFSFVVGQAIVELKTIVDGALVSVAMRYYNPQKKKIVLMAFGSDGNPWTLNEDVESRVVQSDPHKMLDGQTMTLRWTPQKLSHDKMILLMERSMDGGKTWAKGNIQTMTRIAS